MKSFIGRRRTLALLFCAVVAMGAAPLAVKAVVPGVAKAATGAPGCTAGAPSTPTMCDRVVTATTSKGVAGGPQAIAGVPVSLDANLRSIVNYPTNGFFGMAGQVRLDIRSNAGLSNIAAAICSSTNSKVRIQHQFQFQGTFAGSVGVAAGPFSAGATVLGPKEVTVGAVERQGCGFAYNTEVVLTVPDGVTSMNHIMIATANPSQGAATEVVFNESVPFTNT